MNGISFDGGYGEYMVVPVEAVVLVPAQRAAIWWLTKVLAAYGANKKQLALDLGAHVYIDSSAQDPVEVLKQRHQGYPGHGD